MPPLDLDQYTWSHRPLLIFATHENLSALDEQRRRLTGQNAALADRKMVVIEVIGNRVTVYGQDHDIDPAALKMRYGIDESQTFAVLLVGKDTGVKLRRAQPVAMDEVFGLIDSMPMRRREMRERSE
ncbi:MAG: DUF4174 domain-containing protein [Planctomycetota bacterium]